jgi:hypothetical protein
MSAGYTKSSAASVLHLLTEVARGDGDLDWSALARLAAENAGLEPPVFKATGSVGSGAERD